MFDHSPKMSTSRGRPLWPTAYQSEGGSSHRRLQRVSIKRDNADVLASYWYWHTSAVYWHADFTIQIELSRRINIDSKLFSKTEQLHGSKHALS